MHLAYAERSLKRGKNNTNKRTGNKVGGGYKSPSESQESLTNLVPSKGQVRMMEELPEAPFPFDEI